MARLAARQWPGNVRELENACEMLVALSDGTIDLSLLSEGHPTPRAGSLRERMLAFEKANTEQALSDTAGSKTEAARALGIGRVTLYEKLRKHGLGRAGANVEPGPGYPWTRRASSATPFAARYTRPMSTSLPLGLSVPDPDPVAWTLEAQMAVARFDPTPSWRRRLASYVVATGSRFVMQVLNRVDVIGGERLDGIRAEQRPGRGLLTFSNHVGLLDDPWLLSCFCPPQWGRLRWIGADAHNFFGTDLKARISSAGKAVPLVRGAGLDQPGMHFLVDRLRAGEWVHIFPEGGRSREPGGRLRRPLKPGLAYLVQNAQPLLLPFYHRGMDAVQPIGARLPGVGHRVSVRFGQGCASLGGLSGASTDEIGDWAEAELLALEQDAFAGAGS